MALKLNDRVKEATASIGVGPFNLAGAPRGFQSFFNGIGDTNSTYYTAVDPIAQTWEVGVGTVNFGVPVTLSRTTVLSSSAAGAKINFANPPIVWCDLPASKIGVFGSRALRKTVIDDVVAAADGTVMVDATAGNRIIVFPLALGSAGGSQTVLIVKSDVTANTVTIKDDGGTYVDEIRTPAVGGAISGRWIFSDGAKVWSQGA